jgi:hypothetical protein
MSNMTAKEGPTYLSTRLKFPCTTRDFVTSNFRKENSSGSYLVHLGLEKLAKDKDEGLKQLAENTKEKKTTKEKKPAGTVEKVSIRKDKKPDKKPSTNKKPTAIKKEGKSMAKLEGVPMIGQEKTIKQERTRMASRAGYELDLKTPNAAAVDDGDGELIDIDTMSDVDLLEDSPADSEAGGRRQKRDNSQLSSPEQPSRVSDYSLRSRKPSD